MSYEETIKEACSLNISVKKTIYYYLPKYCSAKTFIRYIDDFCKLNDVDISETEIYTENCDDYCQIFISGKVLKNEDELKKEIEENQSKLKIKELSEKMEYERLKKKFGK